jgi:hypothetical protein
MLGKKVLLVNGDGQKWWLEQKANGTLWESGKEIFASETEANKKGWKIDAVKVVLGSTDGKMKTG